MEYKIISSNLEMVLDESGSVTKLVHRKSGHSFTQCPTSPDGIWALNLIKPSTYNDPVPDIKYLDLEYEGHEWWINRHEHLADLKIDCSQLKNPEISGDQRRLELVWSSIVSENNGSFKLVISVDDEDMIQFNADVSLPETWAIKKVDYPRIRGLGSLVEPELDAVLIPFNWGIIRQNPLECMIDHSGQYPSTYNSVQMTALFQKDQGLYLAVRDPECNHTGISTQYVENSHPTPYMSEPWNVSNDKAPWQLRDSIPLEQRIKDGLSPSLCFQCHHWPEMTSHWKAAYNVVLKAFSGDWFDAAQIHKKWAVNQRWCQRGALYERKKKSTLLLETDLWFSQYGFPAGSFEPKPAWDFQKEMHKLHDFYKMPFGLHWYNWHDFSWHTQYPSHQPVVEGFEEVARELESRGIVIMPYCQGRLLYRDRDTFEQERCHASLESNGQPYLEKYTPGDDWPLALCPGDEWSREQWLRAAEMLWKKYNLKGVYFDQISAMPPSLCYHEGHGHALGGGNQYWKGYDSFLGSLEVFKEEDEDRFFASECMADAYLDRIDAFLSIVPPLDNMVPFFSAVYGEYTTCLGRSTPVAIMKDVQLFAITQGEQLVFGGLVGWLNSDILKYPESAEYLKKLAVFRGQVRDLLNFGVMERPIPIVVHGEELEFTIDASLCLHDEDIHVKRSALVSTFWKHPDNRRLLLLLNEDTVEREIQIPEESFEGAESCRIHRLGLTEVKDISITSCSSLTLAPLELVGLEF